MMNMPGFSAEESLIGRRGASEILYLVRRSTAAMPNEALEERANLSPKGNEMNSEDLPRSFRQPDS